MCVGEGGKEDKAQVENSRWERSDFRANTRPYWVFVSPSVPGSVSGSVVQAVGISDV